MNEFVIKGEKGFIRIEIEEVYGFPEETSPFGGYDVKGKIEIKSGNYYVREGVMWFSTGQIYEFFIQLQKCYSKLAGNAKFTNYESSFQCNLYMNKLGQVAIQGYFQELGSEENILQFEIDSDQSYLSSTLEELKKIVDHYGALKGI